MSEFKKNLKEYAKSIGVDLIGFAQKERFEGVIPEENPFTIFPEAKTVILLGKRITRGTLRGVEEGTNFGDYSLFGSSWLDDNINSLMCYDITRYLEDRGYEAVPVFPNPTEAKGMGIPVGEGKAAPNVTPNFEYAVVACGLGEIGYCGEILTPEFGPRQRWQMVITDAEIEEDEILKDSICTFCEKCASVCPLGAITGSREIEICGKRMKTGIIDYNLCKKCKNGAFGNRLLKSAKPDRLAALCVRTCVHELDNQKKVKNTFEKPFRKREAWAIDIYDKSKNIKLD
ncbi:MAG TPA: 4Fe-4S binding protein [Clostridiales bacterium]|nr:4Fe-4S binding protein [Clostridiales bacterium]